MPMPSNNKIEDRALGALRNIIDDHATMGHEFRSMDKEMSWDGNIWIYKDINGTQDKRNYDDKVPIQIKGHVDKNREYIDEQKITYINMNTFMSRLMLRLVGIVFCSWCNFEIRYCSVNNLG